MRRADRGFALPTAIFAIVILAILITGALYVARQEGQIGRSSEKAARAFYLTERAVTDALTNWDAPVFGALPLWGDTTITDTVAEGVRTVTITRMTPMMYYVDATGTLLLGGALQPGATRRMGLIARITSAALEPPAALTTRGSTVVRGTAEVHGEDIASWGPVLCPDPLVDKPGLMTDNASQAGTAGAGSITGNPAIQQDPSINDDTFRNFGGLLWDDLIQMADYTFSTGFPNSPSPTLNANGTCNVANTLNWGSPLTPAGPCGSHFPIIYVSGSASIQGNGQGQGILLIEGDLDLRGNFVFYGVVIVQGTFETQSGGPKILGGVMAANALFATQALVGGSVVQNSTCAVQRSILNSSLTKARPLPNRAWVDVSSVVLN